MPTSPTGLSRRDQHFIERVLDVPEKDWDQLNKDSDWKNKYEKRSGDIQGKGYLPSGNTEHMYDRRSGAIQGEGIWLVSSIRVTNGSRSTRSDRGIFRVRVIFRVETLSICTTGDRGLFRVRGFVLSAQQE
jgi:hypothetical protein